MSNIIHAQIKQQIQQMKDENLIRTFYPIEKTAFPMGKYNDNEIIVWCSNDYLGMSQHPKVKEAALDGIKKYGVGSGGTRNISGTHPLHNQLEREIAILHNKERAILCTSAYVANIAGLGGVGRKLEKCVIFSDEKNHASMIHGISYSKAQKHIFPHNNAQKLDELLSQYDDSHSKIVAIESVYSMSGSRANLEEIIKVSNKHNAKIYIDEVHGVGLYGKHGGGLTDELNLQDDMWIINGTLAKAFGSIGGYLAADKDTIEFIRIFASTFIFTTSLPPAICAASIESIKILRDQGLEIRKQHRQNIHTLIACLKECKINHYKHDNSHIIIIPINDQTKCKEIAHTLLHDYKIYVQPIFYPTVPRNEALFRICVSPMHTETQIKQLAHAFRKCYNLFNV